MNKSNMTWSQAFKECNDSHNKHDLTMKITNELFPRVNGEVWKNWIGLSEDKRELVYTVLVKIDQAKKAGKVIDLLKYEN